MKKRSAFKYLHEYPAANPKPSEDKSIEDMLISLLTAEDLRILRDPESKESLQILELLKASIH